MKTSRVNCELDGCSGASVSRCPVDTQKSTDERKRLSDGSSKLYKV